MSVTYKKRGLDVYIELLSDAQYSPLRYNDYVLFQYLATVDECINATYATTALRRAAWTEIEQEVRLQTGLTQDVEIASNGWYAINLLYDIEQGSAGWLKTSR